MIFFSFSFWLRFISRLCAIFVFALFFLRRTLRFGVVLNRDDLDDAVAVGRSLLVFDATLENSADSFRISLTALLSSESTSSLTSPSRSASISTPSPSLSTSSVASVSVNSPALDCECDCDCCERRRNSLTRDRMTSIWRAVGATPRRDAPPTLIDASFLFRPIPVY